MFGPEILDEYLRKLSTAVLARTMPPREFQSAIVRSLLREIVTMKVLHPVIELCDQKWLNKIVRTRILRIFPYTILSLFYVSFHSTHPPSHSTHPSSCFALFF